MRKPFHFHARKFKIEIVIFSRLNYQEFPDGDKGLSKLEPNRGEFWSLSFIWKFINAYRRFSSVNKSEFRNLSESIRALDRSNEPYQVILDEKLPIF